MSFLEGKEKFENNTFQNGWYFSAFMVFVDSEANIEVNDFLIEFSCGSEKIWVQTLMKNVRPEFTEEHEFVYQVNKISRFCLQYPDYQETDAIKKGHFSKEKPVTSTKFSIGILWKEIEPIVMKRQTIDFRPFSELITLFRTTGLRGLSIT